MKGRGRRPRRGGLVGILAALAVVAAACGGGAGGKGTTVTYVGVAGGAISFGMTEGPTGCNPNTPAGDTPGTQTVLAGVLPSPFVPNVVTAAGQPTSNPDLIESAEPLSINPQTIVYTLNPKAVWSDGVPITAADFKYAWEEQRGDPVVSSPDVASIAGYRDIASVTGSNGGHTVTVKFKTTFADWQMLFSNLVPAHVMEKVGWNPSCTTGEPGDRPVGRPVRDRVGVGPDDQARAEPEMVGDPGQRPLHHGARCVLDRAARPVDASGFVQVAQPSTVDTAFLSQMTGLPGAQSDVDTSATLLQLDMASSLDAQLSPDLRVAIALLINRQDLVNQQASWAVPGMQVADSHVYVQGQPSYKPAPPTSPTTTIPAPTSSTSTTTIGAGRQRELPGDAGTRPGRRAHSGRRVGPHAGRPLLPLGVRDAVRPAHGGRRERPLGAPPRPR